MNQIAACTGEILADENGYITCSTEWVIQQSVQFDISTVDPAVATVYFGSGFALTIIPWATAYGVKSMLSLIR